MININDHIEEFDGKKYVPYDIALKVINNIYIDGVERQVSEVETEMTSLISRLNKIKLDD